MINAIAKIFAVPVKIINLLLSVLLVIAPFTRVAGVIFYVLVLPVVFGSLFSGDSPDWETALTALLFPTLLTFAEVPVHLLIMLTESLYKWLMYKDHRSTRTQIEEHICHQRYREAKARGQDDDGTKLQELAQQLLDIHEKGG